MSHKFLRFDFTRDSIPGMPSSKLPGMIPNVRRFSPIIFRIKSLAQYLMSSSGKDFLHFMIQINLLVNRKVWHVGGRSLKVLARPNRKLMGVNVHN